MVLITTDKEKPKKSRAADLLEFAVGNRRVHLSKLSKEELTELLAERIESLDFKELRGFDEVQNVLSWRGEDQSATVSANTKISAKGFDLFPFDLKSHVIALTNPLIMSGHDTWRDDETTKERTERWSGFPLYRKNGAYLHHFERNIFVLRRIPRHATFASQDEALAGLTTRYMKLPGKNQYVAQSIIATRIPIVAFCKYFGKHAGNVAHAIIHEIASAHEATIRDLKSTTDRVERSALKWRRLAEATV